MQYCIIYVTCPMEGNYSQIISKELIKNKLAACVNIIDRVTSIYTWQNNLESSNEQLLMIKTKLSLFNKLKQLIKSLHPYDCPEIIVVPIIAGEEQYLEWLADHTI